MITIILIYNINYDFLCQAETPSPRLHVSPNHLYFFILLNIDITGNNIH